MCVRVKYIEPVLTLGDQSLPDLPCEYGGVLPLVLLDLGHDRGRRYLRLAAANEARWAEGTCNQGEKSTPLMRRPLYSIYTAAAAAALLLMHPP